MKWLLTIFDLLLLLFLFVSCIPDEQNVLFETIELQFESPGTGDKQYQDKSPRISVISSSEDVTAFDGTISTESQQVLMDTDYDQYLVVIAFHGQIETTGYGIGIKRITQSGRNVRVYTELIRPKPDQLLGLMVTSPYHIVRLDRKDIPSQQSLTFLLYTDGQTADKQEVFVL